MVPNFILGGAMKSGTTFLHSLLLNHPQVKVIDRNMDYSYFDDNRIYERGRSWYLQLFADFTSNLQSGTIIGQTSADCNFNPGSVKRILEHNPKTKLIFVLRHPIDRAYSLYWHQYGMGREFRRFENAIRMEPKLIKKSYYHFKHYSYIERSRYHSQFEEIKKLMPSENMLIIDFESLVKDTLPTVNLVLDFLGVKKIVDLDELNLSNLSKNPALIPKYHAIVIISHLLQKIGLVAVGRRIINLFREEIRPPKMNEEIRKILEEELKKDIIFFEGIKSSVKRRIGVYNY